MANYNYDLSTGSTLTGTCTAYLFQPTARLPTFAPYVYVDSATPLSLPGFIAYSTAYVVGDKRALNLYAQANQFECYVECTVAGTTGTSLPSSYPPNSTFTAGTAQFVVRLHHGWSRAAYLNTKYVPGYFSTVLISSNTTYTMLSGYPGLYLYSPPPSWLSTDTGAVVSVSKTSDRVTTYAAGATIISGLAHQGGNAASPQMSFLFARGITYTRNYDGTYQYGNDMRDFGYATAYDCTFNAARSYVGVGTFANHTPPRHSIRCTFNCTYTSPNHLVGHSYNTTFNVVMVAPTVTATATGNANTNLFLTDPQANGCYLSVFGGNFSTLTSYNSWYTGTVYTIATKYNGLVLRGTRLPAGKAPTYTPSGNVIIGAMDGTSRLTTTGSNDSYSSYEGRIRTSTTTYRSGGASDAFGAYSLYAPVDRDFRVQYEMAFYNTRVEEGFTITVEILVDLNGNGLTDWTEDDIWMAAIYPTSATTMEGAAATTFSEDRLTGYYHLHASPVMLTASGATWVGTPTGFAARKLMVTVNPRRAGTIRIKIGGWQAPYTRHRLTTRAPLMYIDPTITLGVAA